MASNATIDKSNLAKTINNYTSATVPNTTAASSHGCSSNMTHVYSRWITDCHVYINSFNARGVKVNDSGNYCTTGYSSTLLFHLREGNSSYASVDISIALRPSESTYHSRHLNLNPPLDRLLYCFPVKRR
jgi:hypothetical protein